MSDLNRVFLVGRVGNDPELKTSAQGAPYLRISLATNAQKADGEKITYWHRVVIFGNQAQVCATYLHKGARVLIEGSLEVRTYTGDDDRKVTNVSVVAQSVKFIDVKRRSEQPAAELAADLAESA